MRKTLHYFLSRQKCDDIYLLHCDMWGFETKCNLINCGVQESNMVNIAAGLASQGKKVIIYGVAGFVIYKAYEQIKFNIKGFAENFGSIIFVNAGHNGCYSVAGRGHLIDDDEQLCKALGIPMYSPFDRKTFIKNVLEGIQKKGVRFIRLGWDNVEWKIEKF
ncbi:MAG: hypothetical protein A2504_06945 [Bdellovibrionales bacterium RIFOXYD12_FULL_39_22]|nr:MAG: hypothetical protein A2385_05160 [Bdellovibrionales bacterium RIFOXYB1_FULL_39_21]OFZ44311.1 MAG: hypothetical protein A2485_15940 [Bdellovibrionales bacterium RIFOXYC12_FULL_39_17]OFZ49166.1 MAG: hypothetical protein A2404_15880 [Bdellovibrionales bacterium RIFOXYC1_FULL_39_130]OFZ72242.1 MAG: hypothetical protein A2451_15785 [Bdellovibrionales bacterium RIFOXYC2_FULL_39_8]OFZ76974.1 MAG: hypothetical protein A2560_10965 [Bdellovibrionales bacterium RIFOXYD1_FULL_39_84]OFZ95187.1 MAG: